MYDNLIKRLRDILNGKTMSRELWVETMVEATYAIAELVEKNDNLADGFTDQYQRAEKAEADLAAARGTVRRLLDLIDTDRLGPYGLDTYEAARKEVG